MKKKIFISSEFFPPAYKAGGPIKSVNNLANALKIKYDIFIITSARDLNAKSLMDLEKINIWVKKNGINLIYVDSTKNIIVNIARFFFNNKIHFCYISSFFNPKFSLIPIIFSFLFNNRIMIAPKGELFDEALSNKKLKKSFYIFFIKIFNFFLNINWHATSVSEKSQIKKIFNHKNDYVTICSNIVEINNKTHFYNKIKKKNALRIIIPCRITPIKNIYRTILSLKKLEGNIDVHIFGVIDDLKYWKKCENEILKLSRNIRVKYKGSVTSEELFRIYPKYNIFLMPSMSENFGYSIFEALSFGLPVIIGKNNPWTNLERLKIGFNVDPYNISDISKKIQSYVNMIEEDFKIIRKNCKLFTENFSKKENKNIKKILLNLFEL